VKPLSAKDPKEIGGFTLVGRLGAGGMGVVYLASRRSESVALKVVRESLIDDDVQATRFTREVSTLEKIKSPNVARIVEAGVDEGTAWFAAEFVNGPNLSELVNDKGPLDEDQWWELARGLLNGLADVHKTGVIHRDVKPANLIIAETGPKLIDFGIAHVSDATSVTATGLVAGSPAWFSPEQIEGFELTPATDIFSAGSVLTFAATGSSPWGGETTMTKASVFKILTSEPSLEGLSPEQQNLVSLMLEKEPPGRPTAASLVTNLDAIRAAEEPKPIALSRGGKKPDLESSYSSVTRKSNDATTTTKRSVLKETERGSGQTNTTSGGVSTAVTGTMFSKNRTRLLVGAISGIAILGISLLVANSSGSGTVSVSEAVSESKPAAAASASGSGKVNVSKAVSEINPALGDFSILLSSGSTEPVTLVLTEKDSFASVSTWKTGEPLRVSFSPPFSEDESYEGTVFPQDLGLDGLSNGSDLYIHVSLEETSTLLSFRNGADEVANEVYSVRLFRGNEKAALNACVQEQKIFLEATSEPYRNLHRSYEAHRAQAAVYGDNVFYQYETWVAKINGLISAMLSDLSNAASTVSQDSRVQQYVTPMGAAQEKLIAAWSGLRSSAEQGIGRGDDSAPGWDAAWQQIYSAESQLSASVSVSTSSLAGTACGKLIQ